MARFAFSESAEPGDGPHSTKDLLGRYLDYYRECVLRKVEGMDERELRTSRLPSGWTPLELLKHLAFMERRWFQWGFAGRQVPDPWGDRGPDMNRWYVPDGESWEEVRAFFNEQCERSRAVLATADLEDVAATGGRFEEDPPRMVWILLHVLQEYARHTGHLDIVRELADGTTGE
jgi:hypothetical protein